MLVLTVLLFAGLAQAATLHGNIYDLDFERVTDAVVEITSQQQMLAEEGAYSFELPDGTYILKAHKGELSTVEQVTIKGEGDYVFDLFLFPGFEEEDQMLDDLGLIEEEENDRYPLWSYLLAAAIFLIAIGRIILAKKKYGKRPSITQEVGKKEPAVENLDNDNLDEETKEEPQEEPAYLDDTLNIIKKHEGRITQKELRREMIHLSEAKVSLILTELEHKGKIEKIKKGRGNVIILK